MSTPDPSLLLNICPICCYSLEGLPVEHKCPECGFAFDRRWQVFSRRVRPGRLGRFWPVYSVLAFAVQGCFIFSFGSTRTLAIIIGVILAILVIAIVMLMCRRTRWLAITPTGIRDYRERDLVREYSWDDFTTAEYVSDQRIVLRGPWLNDRISMIDGEVMPFGEVRSFVDTVNSYPHRPAAPTDATSSDGSSVD